MSSISLPRLTLPNKEKSAMSELSAVRSPVVSAMLSRIGHMLVDGLHAYQYARLSQAISRVSEEQLELAGLSRAEILRRARASIDSDRG